MSFIVLSVALQILQLISILCYLMGGWGMGPNGINYLSLENKFLTCHCSWGMLRTCSKPRVWDERRNVSSATLGEHISLKPLGKGRHIKLFDCQKHRHKLLELLKHRATLILGLDKLAFNITLEKE